MESNAFILNNTLCSSLWLNQIMNLNLTSPIKLLYILDYPC